MKKRPPQGIGAGSRPLSDGFSSRILFRAAGGGMGLVAALAWVVGGCSSAHYQKAADREVYGIIDQVEKEVFGQAQPFTIDTAFSSRAPGDVPVEEIIEGRQETNTLFLTIEEALNLAVKNSREYQAEKERLYLSALSLTGERYAFSPQFFGGSTGEFTRDQDNERFGGVNSRVGVTQFLKSGANLGVTLVNDYLRFYTGDPRKSVVSTLSVNLFQPLLRGAGAKVAAENLKQAERNVIYAMRSFSQFQRQFAVDVVSEYFRLLQDKDQVRNAYADYKIRLETIRFSEARGEAGIERQVAVDEARSDEQDAKNSYIFIVTNYRNNLDRFKLTLGLPLSTRIQLDDSALDELQEAGLQALDLDSPNALIIAVEQQLELLNEIDRFEDSKRKVVVAANRLKTELNIFADASLRSEEPTDYTDFDLNDIRAGAGLELNLPLDRLRERNDYRASRINFEASLRTLGLALDSKKDQIDRGLRNLESLRRSYEIRTNSVAIAERRVAGEQLSLKAGRRTVRDISEAQDELLDSQNQVTSDLVNHLAAKLQFLLDVGVLDTDVEKFWIQPEAIQVPAARQTAPAAEAEASGDIPDPDKVFQL